MTYFPSMCLRRHSCGLHSCGIPMAWRCVLIQNFPLYATEHHVRAALLTACAS